MTEDVASAVEIDPALSRQIDRLHRLSGAERLRLVFLAGPGDAVGTFEHWVAGRHDTRVPVITYSGQFYSLVEKIGAEALVLTEPEGRPAGRHPNIGFARIPRARNRRGLGWHLDLQRYAWRLLRAIRRFRPHAVVLSPELPAWFYRALPRRAFVVLTVHNTFWPMGRRDTGARKRLRQALAGFGLRRMDAAVCTSHECARQLAALTGRRDGIHVEVPQILRSHIGAIPRREAAQRLLFLGRIEEDKGVFDLLRAFETLAARFPQITLTLAGTGTAAARLAAEAAASPHADRITYAGNLDAGGVHAALKAADLLVVPTRSSFNEGLALVVFEAAAQGVPAVLSSVVPARDMAVHSSVVFPADDQAALAEALASLIADPARYRALADQTAACRAGLLDRGRSWGSCLARVLARQPAPSDG